MSKIRVACCSILALAACGGRVDSTGDSVTRSPSFTATIGWSSSGAGPIAGLGQVVPAKYADPRSQCRVVRTLPYEGSSASEVCAPCDAQGTSAASPALARAARSQSTYDCFCDVAYDPSVCSAWTDERDGLASLPSGWCVSNAGESAIEISPRALSDAALLVMCFDQAAP